MNKHTDSDLILIGPEPIPITGQSVAFLEAQAALPEGYTVYLPERASSLLRTFVRIVRFLQTYVALLSSLNRPIIYLTTSRSRSGFLRDLPVVLLGRLYRARRIVNHLHGADFVVFYDSASLLLKCGIDFVYRRIDRSIVLSERMREQYKRYPMRTVAVPNGCIVPQDVPTKEDPSLTGVRILYISNVMRSKGVLELMDAIIDLHNCGTRIILDVAGAFMADHITKSDQIEYEFRSRLDPTYMTYHGIVRGEKKEELLRNAHILALPSYYPTEAQPICLIEGLSYGCFLIATDQGYIKSIMDENNGHFVDPDRRSIREAIERFIADLDTFKKTSLANYYKAKTNFAHDTTRKLLRTAVLS